MVESRYDVIVVGSGQSGTPLAKAFASAGRRTALVERSAVGGTCVNVGCTPTKTMIASGRVAYLARRAADYGVNTGGDIDIDMEVVRQRKRDIVTRWHSGSVKGLEKAGVDVVMGNASFVGEKKIKVHLNDGGEREMDASTIFLNVGDRPLRPDTEGLDEIDPSRVLDSTSIMELDEVPNHLVILGGGYISLEFGQLFRRLGSQVTIIQRGKRLVSREDDDVSACMLDILKEDGITVHLSSSLSSVAKTGDTRTPLAIKVRTELAETLRVPASHLLLAAGRVPNTDGLNLSAVGIETSDKGYFVVDEKLQTTAPGVYALGDAHGGPAFTHISYDDSRIIRANFLPETLPSSASAMSTTQSSSSRRLTPYVVYTDPQLGHVGLHARDLESSGRKFKTAKMPMSSVARALETAEPRGIMKATVDAETGEILGFTCLGLEGGEIMSIVQTAMMGGLKWWDLEAAVWSHPTLAESLNNLWGYLD